MTTISVLLAIGFVAALAAMSIRAGRGVPQGQGLPMQWGLDGRPNWFAPRNLALAFTPVLAALVLIPTALLSLKGVSGQDGRLFLGVLTGMGLVWVGVHALYLHLVQRWRRSLPGA